MNNVRFSQERSPYGGDAWLEMEIEVDLRGNPSPSAPNREFLDDLTVEVALALGWSVAPFPASGYIDRNYGLCLLAAKWNI